MIAALSWWWRTDMLYMDIGDVGNEAPYEAMKRLEAELEQLLVSLENCEKR